MQRNSSEGGIIIELIRDTNWSYRKKEGLKKFFFAEVDNMDCRAYVFCKNECVFHHLLIDWRKRHNYIYCRVYPRQA